MNVTKEQIAQGLNTIRAVADTIRELKTVPNGVLYAQLMGVMDLAQYDKIIGILKRTGLVKETNHLLEWIEPA